MRLNDLKSLFRLDDLADQSQSNRKLSRSSSSGNSSCASSCESQTTLLVPSKPHTHAHTHTQSKRMDEWSDDQFREWLENAYLHPELVKQLAGITVNDFIDLFNH